jgi:hypothetical protein
MKCINIRHPDFIKLLEITGKTSFELELDIASFQNSENSDLFPTAQELYPNESLNQPEILFGLETNDLEFHVNTLNVIGNFLENIGVEQRLVTEFLAQDGSVVKGALAAANFLQGTVDIIENIEQRPSAWNKLPEEAAHWWYRLLKNTSLKEALTESDKTKLKNKELFEENYGEFVARVEDLTEESIGQLIAETIKKIEEKNASPADYSFFRKFLEWVNSVLDIFRTTNQDPFEVAAMKILASDMSDLMSWEEYSALNNIVNFSDVLTEQSVAPLDYTIIEDIGTVMTPEDWAAVVGEYFRDDVNYYKFRMAPKFESKYGAWSPQFNTKQELDTWVLTNITDYTERQKVILQEVRDNQLFFDRLLNKTFRKKSKFLPKTLKKYYSIINSTNLTRFREWDISDNQAEIVKKLSPQEKQQIELTNSYTNIAPTLKALPGLLQKYKKNPIVLSESIKIDGAKKQELAIIDGIKDLIKIENPELKSISAEEFVAEAHNWLQTNYLLGFANETAYLSYRTDQTFKYISDRVSDDDIDLNTMTQEDVDRLPMAERQRIANIVGLTKQKPDVYHNKVSLRFNDMYHLKGGHFNKAPSAWGNLTYFYTGQNQWKDAVLLHEIQNDNIEFLRDYKVENKSVDDSLGSYLKSINASLLTNIDQIASGGKKIVKDDGYKYEFKHHKHLTSQLENFLQQPLEQGLNQLKESLNERIELYKSENSSSKKAQELVDNSYSKRRKFTSLQKRGGIKSLLTSEDIMYFKSVLHELNTVEVEGPAEWSPDDNVMFPGDFGIRNLKAKKEAFLQKTAFRVAELNKKYKELYGEGAPYLSLEAPAKPLPKALRRGRVINAGTNRERTVGNNSQELNESLDYLLMHSEKKISAELSKDIVDMKKNYIDAVKKEKAYNFNVSLSKITQEQFSTLLENHKYNQNLLSELIDASAQKDLQSKAETTIDKEGLMLQETHVYEYLKQKALDKKAELESKYAETQEKIKQTLEVEMNYFTPLVHHLIQKHIKQYGKEIPMYFSGYEITKLTQGSVRTALIYAGKDEINLVDKNEFTFNNITYYKHADGSVTKKENNQLTKTNQQEYEKAYQQATEEKAKEIKYEAAKQIGLIKDNVISQPVVLEEGQPYQIGKVTIQQDSVEQTLKNLNEYKKKSKENLDRVINTILNISNNRPIETGAIYNAMTQVSGVKLVWQKEIPGLKNNAGGYLVDLSNYNYNVPILYGLSKPVENEKNVVPLPEDLNDFINFDKICL